MWQHQEFLTHAATSLRYLNPLSDRRRLIYNFVLVQTQVLAEFESSIFLMRYCLIGK